MFAASYTMDVLFFLAGVCEMYMFGQEDMVRVLLLFSVAKQIQ